MAWNGMGSPFIPRFTIGGIDNAITTPLVIGDGPEQDAIGQTRHGEGYVYSGRDTGLPVLSKSALRQRFWPATSDITESLPVNINSYSRLLAAPRIQNKTQNQRTITFQTTFGHNASWIQRGWLQGSLMYDTGTGSVLSLIHISEPTRPRLISYAVFCLKKKK